MHGKRGILAKCTSTYHWLMQITAYLRKKEKEKGRISENVPSKDKYCIYHVMEPVGIVQKVTYQFII